MDQQSVCDFLYQIEETQSAKFMLYTFMISVFYLTFVLVRLIIFPGVSDQEVTATFQDLNRSLFSTYFRILFDINAKNALTVASIKQILFAISLSQLQICTTIFNKRVQMIYGQQQQTELLGGKKLSKKRKYIFILYLEVLRPIIAIPLILLHIMQLNLSNSGEVKNIFQLLKEVKRQIINNELEIFYKNAVFIALHITINYSKTLSMLLINTIQISIFKQQQIVFNVFLAFSNFFFDLVETGVIAINCTNLGLIAFQNTTIKDQIEKYISMYNNKFNKTKDDQTKTQANDKNKKQPMSQNNAQYYFFVDIVDLFVQLIDLKQSYQKFSLAMQSYRRINKFKTPNLKDLYKTDDMEQILQNKNQLLEEALCSICLNSMNIIDKQESCKKLNCEHCFHTACIRQWIVQGNPKCPVCNKHVFNKAWYDNQNQDLDNVDQVIAQIDERFREEQQRLNQERQEQHQIIHNDDQNENNQQIDANTHNYVEKEEQTQIIKAEEQKSDQNKEADKQVIQKQLYQKIEKDDVQRQPQQHKQNNIADGEQHHDTFYLEESDQENKNLSKEIKNKGIIENENSQLIQNAEQSVQNQPIQQEQSTIVNKQAPTSTEAVNQPPKNIIPNYQTKILDIPIFTQQNIQNIDSAILVDEIKQQFDQFLIMYQQILVENKNYSLQRQLYEQVLLQENNNIQHKVEVIEAEKEVVQQNE